MWVSRLLCPTGERRWTLMAEEARKREALVWEGVITEKDCQREECSARDKVEANAFGRKW
jgi:hypothetical protein